MKTPVTNPPEPAGARLLSGRGLTRLAIGLAVAASLVGLAKSGRSFRNYDTFRWSFPHLAAHQSLYAEYRHQHYDLFKYSPAFALFMAPFWMLPRPIGLVAWNVLNVWAPCRAVRALGLGRRAEVFVLAFALVEAMTAVANAQSNGLIAGLMIAAFAAFEARRVGLAAVLIGLGAAIKPFAAVAGLAFVFYPRRGRFLGTSALTAATLALLPAAVVGLDGLLAQYRDWLRLLAHDPVHEANFSLLTLAQTWTGRPLPNGLFLAGGLVLLLAPFARRDRWPDPVYRRMTLAGMLLWVVVFNHKAESPTYVIAAYGAGLWAVTAPRSRARAILLALFLVLTELAATDLVPQSVRRAWVQPYRLKALPAVLIWVALAVQLLTLRRSRRPAAPSGLLGFHAARASERLRA